jgi:type I restriction enzyme, S subunit
VNISKLNSVPIPLPPLGERLAVVEEVKLRRSVLDEVETEVEANLKHISRLRQAILKRAFEGKLVSQDASDVPASELLQHIRREREQASAKKPKRKSRQKATAKINPAGHAGTLF